MSVRAKRRTQQYQIGPHSEGATCKGTTRTFSSPLDPSIPIGGQVKRYCIGGYEDVLLLHGSRTPPMTSCGGRGGVSRLDRRLSPTTAIGATCGRKYLSLKIAIRWPGVAAVSRASPRRVRRCIGAACGVREFRLGTVSQRKLKFGVCLERAGQCPLRSYLHWMRLTNHHDEEILR